MDNRWVPLMKIIETISNVKKNGVVMLDLPFLQKFT